jgi:formate dehydrogenase gamma subunit
MSDASARRFLNTRRQVDMRQCVLLLFLMATIVSVFPGAVALYAQDDCMDCHGDPELTGTDKNGNEKSLFIDLFVYRGSIHGDFDCRDCHENIKDIPHEERLARVDCSICHDDVFEEYERSVHGRGVQEDPEDAPSCADCHGTHDILPSSNLSSKTNPLNLAMTCAKCHADPRIVKKHQFPVGNPLEAYQKSVHGYALITESNFDAATCASCHGSHEIRSMADPKSTIYWTRVASTCGKCHEEIAAQYEQSVHGVAVRKGVRNAPVCIDCHGEHAVKSPQDPNSPVHPLRVSKETCERCHSSELMTQRYGIPGERVKTYEDSYHGLATKGGSLAAANCASCHGIHNILPSSDPRSLINPANLPKTCGQCHPNVTENVAKGPVHLTTSTTPGRVVRIVQRLYIYLIVVVIGFMIFHNVLDFVQRIRKRRWLKGHGVPSHIYQSAVFHNRWTASERIQHWSLVVSFFLLVVTGFALKYPDVWWVRNFVGFNWLFNLRGLIHRIAGAAFLILGVYHIYYMFLTRRGHFVAKSFLVGIQDARDTVNNMLYYLGLRRTAPRFDHFNYMEKMEYYALVWGTIVMGVTGLMLWFQDFTLSMFPRWVIDLLTVIHLYEAWLATLAIIVWHLYFVIFSPDVYPMNTAMVTGKISDEHLRDEYILEWERLHSRSRGAEDVRVKTAEIRSSD